MKTQTPYGVCDFTPNETKAMRELSHQLCTQFEEKKYLRVRTPTFEYLDSLKPGMSPHLVDQCIKFFDGGGQTLTLRPDHTLTVSRLVSTRMKNDPLPLRLHYSAPIFRRSTLSQEIFQAGFECFGISNAKSDAEIILLCIQTLESLGLTDFRIDIGHTDFVSDLSEEKKKALLSGDFITLGALPERGQKEIIQEHPYLLDIAKLLEKENKLNYICFNKGLVKNLNYYTGIILDCYSLSTKKTLGSGGRYDRLLAQFGFNCPAVGFTFDKEAILACLRHKKGK